NYITDYLGSVGAGAPGSTPPARGGSSAKITIENVVASASLGEELDLQAIARVLGGAEYEPEQFPGLIYRLKEPKTAILLFRSGKVVCTGAKSLEHVKTAIDLVTKQIAAAGVPVNKDPEIVVQNIVATSDLGAPIDLNAIAISLGGGKVEYEPEQFPGLVYRIDEPKVVVLLFGSGKLVCTGDLIPKHEATKIFLIFYLPIGIGVGFTVLASIGAKLIAAQRIRLEHTRDSLRERSDRKDDAPKH